MLSGHRLLVLLIVLLLAVRLVVVWIVYPYAAAHKPEWRWSNNDGYDRIALNWVETGVYGLEQGVPTAQRLPLYPAYLAACCMLAGRGYAELAMIGQVAMSVMTGLYLYRLGARLFTRRVAALALLVFILHLQVNNFVFRCATETLFILLTVGFVYHTTVLRSAMQWRDAWLAGFYSGLAMLTRSTLWLLLLIVPVVFLVDAMRHRRGRMDITRVVLVLLLPVIIQMPWLMRNARQSGMFPVYHTWVGHPFYQGSYVVSNIGSFLQRRISVADLDQAGLLELRESREYGQCMRESEGMRPVAREVLADRCAREMAIRRVSGYGWRLIPLAVTGMLAAPALQMTWTSTLVLAVVNFPLIAAGLAGALLLWKRNPGTLGAGWIVLATFAYGWVVHAAVWPQARYVLPMLVPFLVYAGYCLDACLPARDGERKTA